MSDIFKDFLCMQNASLSSEYKCSSFFQKGTKSEIELGRTFSTILSDMEFRQQLLYAETEEEFREMLHTHARDLGEEQRLYRRRSLKIKEVMNQVFAYVSLDVPEIDCLF